MTEYTKAIESMYSLLEKSYNLMSMYGRLCAKGTKYERSKYKQKIEGIRSVRGLITRALQDLELEERMAIEDEYEAYVKQNGDE